ncbi:MAG: ABC transporter permease subunit [Bacilli bacterium]
MKRLLKADFYRILKSKLTIAALIIIVAFVLINNFSYLFLKNMLESEFESDPSMSSLFSARSFFVQSFSSTNNVGLLIPIFTSIIMCSDFSSGTLRNKIITGHKRSDILLSSFITGAVYNVVLILLYSLLNLLLGTLLFGYGTDFNGEQFLLILKELWAGCLQYIYLSSLITLLAFAIKKVSLTIILQFVVQLVFDGFLLVASLLQTFDIPKIFQKLNLIIPINPVNEMISSSGASLANTTLLVGTISTIIFIVINIIVGNVIFKESDIK